MTRIRRAIISVTDKRGIVDFARELSEMGVEIISTGGTGEMLKNSGIGIIPISSYTGFPEMLDGRVKTLHPKIHGGILGIRENETHKKEMKDYGIPPIDMVVVNLYAFEETVRKGGVFEEAIENIDIGGPTMIRASAKNFNDVACVTDPEDYDRIIREMRENNGCLSKKTRFYLARKAFQLTARYDAAISNYLGLLSDEAEKKEGVVFPETYTVQFRKIQDLRYGENPHQGASFYASTGNGVRGIAGARRLHGKELSFNNILDLNSALEIVTAFDEPCAVIVKHNNPCGVGTSDEGLVTAYNRALSCDRVSAFGGIVGFNRRVSEDLARVLTEIFLEAVVAPGFDEKALDILSTKKNLRVVEVEGLSSDGFEIKTVSGGVLIQTPDTGNTEDIRVVTRRKPTEDELRDMLFAWKVCRYVKSNAIVLAKGGQTIGIGAGQMSRVDSTRIALWKAEDGGFNPEGSVLASDAFFPFRDSIDLVARKKVRAVIQPGGSVRDEEVIDACNEHDIAMVFTGRRHFRH